MARRPNDARVPLQAYHLIYAVTIAAFLLMAAYIAMRMVMTIS